MLDARSWQQRGGPETAWGARPFVPKSQLVTRPWPKAASAMRTIPDSQQRRGATPSPEDGAGPIQVVRARGTFIRGYGGPSLPSATGQSLTGFLPDHQPPSWTTHPSSSLSSWIRRSPFGPHRPASSTWRRPAHRAEMTMGRGRSLRWSRVQRVRIGRSMHMADILAFHVGGGVFPAQSPSRVDRDPPSSNTPAPPPCRNSALAAHGRASRKTWDAHGKGSQEEKKREKDKTKYQNGTIGISPTGQSNNIKSNQIKLNPIQSPPLIISAST